MTTDPAHETRPTRPDPGHRRTAVQTGAAVVAIVFLLVGIAGFIPAITTHYGSMSFAGPESGAMLLGIFQVSILHNVVHLLFGVLGLAMARRVSWARSYLIAGGFVYLLLWIYGLIIDRDSQANFIPLNDADDWLHLGLTIGMVLLGLVPAPRERTPRSAGYVP
ncbi:DUF4383 domain-containing protein [Georgenia yuyongxinii]